MAVALLLVAVSSQASARPVPVGMASEAVSRLHAGLNVAALYCRKGDQAHIVEAFARIRVRHRELLAAAFAAERRRYGAGAIDRHMTQVYNRFANQSSMAGFCRAAASIADQVSAMDSDSFADAAPGFLADLEGPPQ